MKDLMSTTSRAAILAAVLLAAPAAFAAEIVVDSAETDTVDAHDNDHLTVTKDGSIVVDGNQAVDVEDAPSIDNFGTIHSTDDAAVKGQLSGSGIAVVINNHEGAVIGTDGEDADALNLEADGDLNGSVTINNDGTIEVLNGVDGRTVNLSDLKGTGGTLTVTLNNSATGVITSTNDEDMIRLGGKNTVKVVNNWGRIVNDGYKIAIDFEDKGTGTVHNYAGGLIEGGKHAIGGEDIAVEVINDAGGTIKGRNGSGINVDGENAVVTVTNRGDIIGGYDPLAEAGTGDGDAIDVDGKLLLENWGTIRGEGAGGVNEDDDLPNGSEGIAVGGGSIRNYAGGQIVGLKNGILIDDSHQASAPFATVIETAGLIEGTQGDGIRITGTQNDSVVVYATGTVRGANDAVYLGGGSDSLTLYAGSTIVGTLDGGNNLDDLDDADDTLEENDVLKLAGSGDATLGATTSNFETLDVSGGDWHWTGARSFADIDIDTGASLRLDGVSMLFGFADIDVAGTLDASGSLDGADIALGNGGTFRVAGNGIGSVSVGSLDAGTDPSTIAIDIAANGDRDFINVLDGMSISNTNTTLAVNAAAGAYHDGQSFAFANAGSISGNIATVETNLTFLDASVSNADNTLTLTLARNDVAFADVAETANQKAVAKALDHNAALADAVVGATGDAATTFEQLAGDTHASTASAVVGATAAMQTTVDQQIDAAFQALGVTATEASGYAAAYAMGTKPLGYNLWAQGVVSHRDVDGNANAAGYSAGSGGLMVGADTVLDNGWIAGVFGGYSRTDVNVADRAAEADIDSFSFGAYAGGRLDAIGIKLGGVVSGHGVSTSRDVALGGPETLTADYGAASVEAFGEVSYELALTSALSVKPFLGLAYLGYGSDGFTEKGGLGALTSDGVSYSTGIVSLGVIGTSQFATGEGVLMSLNGTIAWKHLTNGEAPTSDMAFAGGGSFTVEGTPIAQDALVLGAGLNIDLNANLSIGAGYDGQFADGEQSHALKARLTGKF